MSSPVTPLEPGTHLGDFLVDALLGQGGGGAVYAARWGHRAVALKLLREDLLGDPSERRRFVEEARTLAEINHPGVVRVLGFGDLPDSRPYLAMERLEGESLAERIGRGPLALPIAIELFVQLAQAVQALHHRNLVHRDIKPENVFLVQGERYAVLLDFGIAKPLFSPDSTVTRQGGVRGTPAYMAPERFFGAPASPATDIYELGVVLYLMLTALPPWEATDDPVTRLNPRRPSELGVHLPGRLEEVIARSLSTRAENRPASASELAALVTAAATEGGPTRVRRTADLSVSPAGLGSLATGPDGAVTGPDDHAHILSLGAVTTASRATGQAEPSPPLPSRDALRRRRPRRIAALFALALVATLLPLGLILLWPRTSLEGTLLEATGLPGRTPGAEPSAVLGSDLVPAQESPPFDVLMLRLHPPDTHILARLIHEEMRQSAFWKALAKDLRKQGWVTGLWRHKNRCLVDLLGQITWISLGVSGDPKSPSAELLVSGQFTRNAVETCFTALGSPTGGEPVVKPRGPVSRVRLEGQHFFMAWPDDHSFFVSNRAEATDTWLKERLRAKAPLGGARALLPMYRVVDLGSTLIVMTSESSLQGVDILKGIPTPQGFSLSLSVRDGLTLRGMASFPNEPSASLAETIFRQRLDALLAEQPAVSLVLARSEVSRQKNVVTVLFATLDRLSGMVGAAVASALEKATSGISWLGALHGISSPPKGSEPK